MVEVCKFFRSFPTAEHKCKFNEARCCCLLGPHGSGKTSLAFQFCCQRIEEIGADSIALYLCVKSKALSLNRFPPLYSEGMTPSDAILKRILVKYVNSEAQIKDVLAKVQLLPSLPCCIVIDDWMISTEFATDKSQKLCFSMLGTTVNWISESLTKKHGKHLDCIGIVIMDKLDSNHQQSLPVTIEISQINTTTFALNSPGGATTFTYDIVGSSFNLHQSN